MAKKRTTLDAILPAVVDSSTNTASESFPVPHGKDENIVETSEDRPQIKQQTLYLKLPLHRQLRLLAFEEEKKMHDLWLESLDLLFANRGLPSIAELTSE